MQENEKETFESIREGLSIWAAFLKELEENPDRIISRWFSEKLPVIEEKDEDSKQDL